MVSKQLCTVQGQQCSKNLGVELGEGQRRWGQIVSILITAPSLTGCRTNDNLLVFCSVPQFSHLHNGGNNGTYF